MLTLTVVMLLLQEVLSLYLFHHPDSIAAINLKACIMFRQGAHCDAAVGYHSGIIFVLSPSSS